MRVKSKPRQNAKAFCLSIAWSDCKIFSTISFDNKIIVGDKRKLN